MIPRETIDQIRETVDIVDVIGDYLRLKKRGKNYLALCPFHTEKTPSFNVSADKQMYYCFGCGKGGNAITFLMEHENMSFIEAVRLLAQKANITIQESGSDYRREQLERLNYAQRVALEYFQKLLRSPKYAMVLNDYLKKRRGITDDAIEYFQLGLAGENWEGFVQHAAKKDLSGPELLDAGLAVFSDKTQKYLDRFRQRLMIPIFNLSSKPIAFGGRTLKKGEPAKYVNSPETKLYSKSMVLYGLNFARDAIREAGSVLVVEGYFDVISLWQCGIRNVVASSGTAFTAHQARLLARFTDAVYLFFDADSAGQQAALRSVDSLYDAGLDIKVMISPEGEDPDSIARKYGVERIQEIMANSVDYIAFRTRGIRESGSLVEKERLVKEFAELAPKIKDRDRRELFWERASAALSVSKELIDGSMDRARHGFRGVEPRIRSPKGMEEYFLSLLMEHKGPKAQFFEAIAPDDFDSKRLARFYEALLTQFRIEGDLYRDRLIEMLADDEMRSLVSELSMIEWEEAEVPNEIRAYSKAIIERKKSRIRAILQQELAKAEADGNQTRAAEILAEMKGYGL